jgi:hypothetical protein
MTTNIADISQLPIDIWIRINSYSGVKLPEDQRYTQQNYDNLPPHIRNQFLFNPQNPHIATLDVAADRYQALSYNPSLTRVCRLFRTLFFNHQSRLIQEIDTRIAPLLKNDQGRQFVLDCIKYGFYLETLRFYFSCHLEELETLLPKIATSFARGCAPVKFIADLLTLGELLNPSLLEKTFEEKTLWEWALSEWEQLNTEYAINRLKNLQKLLKKKIGELQAQKKTPSCFLQRPHNMQALPGVSDVWALIFSRVHRSARYDTVLILKNIQQLPPSIKNCLFADFYTYPNGFNPWGRRYWFEWQEIICATEAYGHLPYNPSLMKTCGKFREFFFANPANQQKFQEIETRIHFLLHYSKGREFLLTCIASGFHLETLRFYFMLHPEDIEILFPKIIQFFLRECTSLKFISSLLTIAELGKINLAEKRFNGKTIWEMLQPSWEWSSDTPNLKLPENKERVVQLQKLFEEKMSPNALQQAKDRHARRIFNYFAIPTGFLLGGIAMFKAGHYMATIAQNFLRFKR